MTMAPPPPPPLANDDARWMERNSDFLFPPADNDDDTGNEEDDERQSRRTGRTARLSDLRSRWDSAVASALLHQRRWKQRRIHVAEEEAEKAEISAVSSRWFDRLTSLHEGSGSGLSRRAYHTMVHLEEMFGHLDLLLPPSSSPRRPPGGEEGEHKEGDAEIDNRAAVDLATFFHDAIYDPTSGTNEEDSAALFRDFLSELFGLDGTAGAGARQDKEGKNRGGGGDRDDRGEDILDRVVYLILATKSHSASPDDGGGSGSDPYLDAFLDADMAVLSKDPGAYDTYAGLIRVEYGHVPRDIYCAKRAEVLASFLADNGGSRNMGGRSIYRTEAMQTTAERRARDNVQREIEMLRRCIIPCEPLQKLEGQGDD